MHLKNVSYLSGLIGRLYISLRALRQARYVLVSHVLKGFFHILHLSFNFTVTRWFCSNLLVVFYAYLTIVYRFTPLRWQSWATALYYVWQSKIGDWFFHYAAYLFILTPMNTICMLAISHYHCFISIGIISRLYIST